MKAYLPIMLIALSLSTLASAQTAEAFRPYITQWEGCKHVPYYRTATGERSVGVGHNTSGDPWQGWYSDADIDRLYRLDYARALDACRTCIDDFDTLPFDAKVVAMSLAWCCGHEGLHRFTGFCMALGGRHYDWAAGELWDSLWARQVSRARLTDHLTRLRSLQYGHER
jgi:GH24 family phage-related lysozyme (muramidase)